jgi:ketosteroid isomerase-like protein
MTENSRQAIVRRFFEAGWNAGDAAAVSDIVHADYASNDGAFFRTGSDVPGGLERLSGVDALADHIGQYQQKYDGLRFTVDRMVVDADTVLTVWSPTGTTRDQTFTDRGGRERPYELRGRGVSLTEVVDGKVTRHDMFWTRDPLFP